MELPKRVRAAAGYFPCSRRWRIRSSTESLPPPPLVDDPPLEL
jgi:hypothetical protein